MDFEHSYWKYAELVNGRLAMIGVIILFSNASTKFFNYYSNLRYY